MAISKGMRVFCPKCNHKFIFDGLVHWQESEESRMTACGWAAYSHYGNRKSKLSQDIKTVQCSRCILKWEEMSEHKAIKTSTSNKTKPEGVRDSSAYVPEGAGDVDEENDDCQLLEEGPDSGSDREADA